MSAQEARAAPLKYDSALIAAATSEKIAAWHEVCAARAYISEVAMDIVYAALFLGLTGCAAPHASGWN